MTNPTDLALAASLEIQDNRRQFNRECDGFVTPGLMGFTAALFFGYGAAGAVLLAPLAGMVGSKIRHMGGKKKLAKSQAFDIATGYLNRRYKTEEMKADLVKRYQPLIDQLRNPAAPTVR